MRPRSIAERAAFIPAVIGPVLGALFLFAPIQGYCWTTATQIGTAPGQTPASTPFPVTTCGTEALWQRQQIFPLPFFAVAVWAIAPVLVYVGVRERERGARELGNVLVLLGVLLECTVLISFGAAPIFAPFVLLPLLITTAFALTRSRATSRPSSP